MTAKHAIIALIPVLGLIGCGVPQPTGRGEPGRWTMTKYLVRYYRTDVKTVHEAGKAYFAKNGYVLEKDSADTKNSLLHGLIQSPQKSLILRGKYRAPDVTEVQLKAGPLYSQDETSTILGEIEKLLPEAAQPR